MLNDHTPIDAFMLSSYPARWIDKLILHSPRPGAFASLSQATARTASLLLSVTLLPAAISMDLAAHTVQGLWSRVSPWSNAEKRSQEAERCHAIAMKCLRGLAGTPLSIPYRDIVSAHFLPEKTEDGVLRRAGLYEAKAVRHTPSTVEEVQQLVYQARAEERKIAIAGAGFCQGKQTLPVSARDFYLDMRQINHVEVDPMRKVMTVGPGATWSDAQQAIDQHGLAIRTMQASNPFSCAGSFSANCHGWDHMAGALANTVESITVVDAQGEVRKLTREDELFGLIAGGYGWFGVIVEMEISLAENEDLFDSADAVPIDDYVDYFKEHVEGNDQVRMHLYRLCLEPGKLLSRGWAQNYSVARTAGHSTALLQNEPERGTLMDRIMMQVARNSPMSRSIWWRLEERNLQKIKKATRNDIMHPAINAVFANNSCA
ncbi:MAG: FAD-binding oxidoreductase, partial [Chlamydiia bacterium]|nr:FAD-binding oxidoreductase [Chlamydiia bacterium]